MKMRFTSLFFLCIAFFSFYPGHVQKSDNAPLQNQVAKLTKASYRSENNSHSRMQNVTLSSAYVSFLTPDCSGCDNKDHDTQIKISVRDANYGLAATRNYTDDVEFKDENSVNNVPLDVVPNFDASSLGLSHVDLTMLPNGHDTWVFEATLVLKLSNGQTLTEPLRIINTQTRRIQLTQNSQNVSLTSAP